MTATTSIHPSTCWECNATCGSLVTVAHGRVSAVRPNKASPHSKGAFCMKGARALVEWTDHPDRLLRPLRRRGARGGGEWDVVSWDDALDEMADRLAAVRERHGPLAIAGAVSGAFFSRGLTVALLMRSLGSPNWLINQDLCGGCRALSDRITGLAMIGGEDIDRAACALVVGRNPYDADPIQWLALKRAKARGARIIVIDPRRTPLSPLADVWLRPRPGTDAAIALAMLNVIIAQGLHDRAFVARWTHGFEALRERVAQYPPEVAERLSGVSAERIVEAARMYADGPSTFVSGHGIDAFSAGVQTFRAFHCLVAVTGNLDREGGNRRVKKPAGFKTYMEVLHDPAFRLPRAVEAKTLGADRFPLWAGGDGWQGACHNPTVIDAMLTGEPYPVRAAYVSGVNIAVTYPDAGRTLEALRSLDFLAVAAHSMTPTAAVADLVLPKTTTLEEEEVALQSGGPNLGFTRAAAPPRGEARNDLDIAVALLDRLEARGALYRRLIPWRSERERNLWLLGDCDIDIETLEADGFATFPYALGDFESDGFATPTGKVELFSETLALLGMEPLPDHVPPACEATPAGDDFPLLLLTGIREKAYHHSRFRDQAWLRERSPHPLLAIHPETAAAHRVAHGDPVRLRTPAAQGACRLTVAVSEDVQPGIVATGMGWWLPEGVAPEFGAREVNINAALAYSGPCDPITGSVDTRGLACRIDPV